MRPSGSFLLLLIFLVFLAGLHYVEPVKKFFPPVSDFIPEKVTDSFLRTNEDSSDLKIVTSRSVNTATSDTLNTSDTTAAVDTNKKAPDALSLFVDSLKKPGKQKRILYYGDSQIEGDRMTSSLRKSLREVSGGTGPGLFLPVMPVMYTKTLWVRSSPGWERYNFLSYSNGQISSKKLGPFMARCRYLAENEVTPQPVTAWVRIRPSSMADSLSAYFDILRIFYRNTDGDVVIKVSAGEQILAENNLIKSDSISEFSCPIKRTGEILIEFTGRASPDIYGMSIESPEGIIVDNIAQRGSAGLEFTMVDSKDLAESYSLLKPDLFILQYGLNVVRNVRGNYSYYEKGLQRQLELLKKVSGDKPVLVIGLTDMAERSGDSLRSYPNIPAIIRAQKSAATETGEFFWDAWNAMGGKASIIRWSVMKEPLAGKDLTHLTYAGADTLAKRLVDSVFTKKNKSETGDTLVKTASITQVPQALQQIVKPITVKKSDGPLHLIITSVLSYDPDEPMIFSSPAFWLFLLIVLAGYSLVYKKLFTRNFYLFLASLFFYYKSGGLFLFLLLFVTVVDYSMGLAIGSSEKRSWRRLFIVLSIISNLGILAYFKYTGFFVDTINNLFGTGFRVYDFLADISNKGLGTRFDISNIILPVGVSFFTFQSLSYTLDVYRRRIAPVRNILDFGFYVSFFPQLVAGPIVRASEFIPQLYTKFHLDKREFSHALFLIAKGLIKKIIISDFIAVNFVDRVFDTPSAYSGFENLMAIYGYGLQIYCDFSGYTDIAIGLGLIFGFRLPVNFNSPYKAVNVSDFWKRWHISLSRWLKDYLYIPLGGNRRGKIRTGINLLITMLLGGLWHGASLRFVIWGFLHGVGLIADRLRRALFGRWNMNNKLTRVIGIFITFNFVSFCWIFFRAPDMRSIQIMLSQIALSFAPGTWSLVIISYSSVLILIFTGYIIHLLPEKIKEAYRGVFIRMPLVLQCTVLFLVAVMLLQMRVTETLPFIYFRF